MRAPAIITSLLPFLLVAHAAPLDGPTVTEPTETVSGLEIIRESSLDAYLPLGDAANDEPAIPAVSCDTNAECLRKGLPLIKPKPRALAPRASGLPPVEGLVEIYSQLNGSSVGYIWSKPHFDGWYGRTKNATEAMVVSVIPNAPQQIMTIIKGKNTAVYPYLGVGLAYGDTSLAAGQNPPSVFVGTPDNFPPGPAQNSYTTLAEEVLEVETSIWQLDTSTNAISYIWVNPPDAGPSAAQAYLEPYNNVLGMTGDMAQEVAQSGGGAFPIFFKFVPT